MSFASTGYCSPDEYGTLGMTPREKASYYTAHAQETLLEEIDEFAGTALKANCDELWDEARALMAELASEQIDLHQAREELEKLREEMEKSLKSL